MAKKIVKVVTITGADDSVQPNELISVAKDFPFVEFGILLSKEQQGIKRFPSRNWLEKLYLLWQKEKFSLSGHLCGSWVRDLCLGKPSFFNEFGYIWEMFKRLQLNFHAKHHPVNSEGFVKIFKQNQHLAETPVIFQMDGVNENIFYSMKEKCGIRVYPLFDASSGCGLLPKEWPKKFGEYCGYAGGLSPENVYKEMYRIVEVASAPIWIDAETLLRSENDTLFDFRKVRRFLDAARPWVIDQRS